MKIFDANISGSLTVSGSAHFQSDITVDGIINATISGTTSNAISSSFSTNADKLDGKDSTEYAITGSNVFKANQTITGSLYVTNDVVINGTSYNAASSGSSGTSGSSGSSGTSGSSGSNGSSGTSGSSGSSGTSGSSGSSGTSGTSGSSGSSGTSGSSGSSGTSGSSGSSGTSGSSGSNGSSGTSGSSGSSGTSGSSGSSGTAGTSGSSGSSGTSGTSGSSGTAGTSGTSVTVSGTNNVLGKFSSGTMIDSSITDNGSVVKINQNTEITGSLTITANLNVLGSSSITYTTASQLRVNDNVITVNTSSPGVRFGGISVHDSGSVSSTGSLFWDSLNNGWVYQHESGSSYNSGMLLSGPRNSGALGSEAGLTNNKVAKSAGGDHLNDSNITDDGTTITMTTNTDVTGSLKVTGGITGTLTGNITGNAATVTTNANLTGNVTSVGNATTIAAGVVTDAMLAGSISNAKLTNSSVTVTAGTGMSGGGAVSLGSSVTLTNAGVTSIIAGTGISRDVATGGVTITNSGVTSAVAGTGVSVSAGTGAVTISIGQAVGTGASVQFANGYITTGLGVGTAAPVTAGLIRATNDVIAYYGSDERLKENITPIENSLDILKQINGYYFDWKEMPGIHENEGHDIGVVAQEIGAVLPEIVTTRDNGYMAVKYEKLVALLIQTNKELLNRVEALEAKIK